MRLHKTYSFFLVLFVECIVPSSSSGYNVIVFLLFTICSWTKLAVLIHIHKLTIFYLFSSSQAIIFLTTKSLILKKKG
ncbi:CLUMA_CG009748, isoform A [Clunio marinus]|uniref:CLUMA_CG009748, isoform A n=1 Tax=Clunio marinus TaxID=568069 RepID=A0A1J1ID07_9DIPT|nr:CLUMA_CG009748, isoform A [Clunio marinus]